MQFIVSDQPNGIPTAGQVAAAQAYVSDPIRRRSRPGVRVGPHPVPVPVTITKLSPDTAAVRDAVGAEIAAMFLDRAEPGRPSTPFVLSVSWNRRGDLPGDRRGQPRPPRAVADPVFTAGLLPVPGPISYQ